MTEIKDIPHTLSYVIRKRQQIDNLNELPKDKRPSEWMIWWGLPEKMERWLDKIFEGKSEPKANIILTESEIE